MSDRVRQTPHIEGNFSTPVSVSLSEENRSELHHFAAKAAEYMRTFTRVPVVCFESDGYHLSLSKHGFLKPHMIDGFLSGLREKIHGEKKMVFYLKPQLEFYINESGNTVFIAVPVDMTLSPNCANLIGVIDSIMTEFGMEKYYAPDPRPHVSLAFSADKRQKVPVNELPNPIELDVQDLSEFRVDVEFITVSIGKSVHTFPLSCRD